MSRRVILGAALAGALLAAPSYLGVYHLGLLTKMLIFALFAMSLDLLLGYTGLPSLGHAVYFGLAAYTVALLARAGGTNFWLLAGAGLAAAALLAAAFGPLTLRARGTYFLMITLALAQVVWGIAFGWRSVTGGDDGLPGLGRPTLFGALSLAGESAFYYFTLVTCTLGALVLAVLVHSPFGKALTGIRESELRMQVLGYHVWRYKYVASVVAGVVAGLAGVVFAYFTGYVSPAYLSIVMSAQVLLMVLFGGAGTLFGPAFGAGAIVLLENVVSAWTQRWLVVLGVIYIVVTLFAPGGLAGAMARWRGPA